MPRAASLAYRQYQRALVGWPKDNIRPNCQLQDVIQRRIDRKFGEPGGSGVDEAAELMQANALYALSKDRYKTRSPLRNKILNPKSQPTYFADLMREIEIMPNKSWLQWLGERIAGKVRLQ